MGFNRRQQRQQRISAMDFRRKSGLLAGRECGGLLVYCEQVMVNGKRFTSILRNQSDFYHVRDKNRELVATLFGVGLCQCDRESSW